MLHLAQIWAVFRSPKPTLVAINLQEGNNAFLDSQDRIPKLDTFSLAFPSPNTFYRFSSANKLLISAKITISFWPDMEKFVLEDRLTYLMKKGGIRPSLHMGLVWYSLKRGKAFTGSSWLPMSQSDNEKEQFYNSMGWSSFAKCSLYSFKRRRYNCRLNILILCEYIHAPCNFREHCVRERSQVCIKILEDDYGTMHCINEDSTSRHLQTDGASEIMNRMVENNLRC